jgi:PAS domain S-box-containing protein
VLSRVQDVTDRERALAALRESQERLALFVEHAPAAIAMLDREMRYLAASRRWASDLGLGNQPILGRSHYEIFPDLPERWKAVHRRCLAGAVEGAQRDPFPRANGAVDWVNWQVHPWRTATGEIGGLLTFSEVVTESVALQARLATTARLAALGTLVAGMAHEINNPLAGELASQAIALEEVEKVRSSLIAGEPVDRQGLARRLGEAVEALRDAEEGGRRIAGLVRSLRVFGQPDERRSRVRLHEIVEEAVRRIPPPLSGKGDVRVVNEGAPEVMASPDRLLQVILDLLANAVRTARVEVADAGVGIAPELLDRIFDPFFTTRAVGQGMGLGLPLCHAVVTDLGGTLTARRVPGKGATFRIELPAGAVES